MTGPKTATARALADGLSQAAASAPGSFLLPIWAGLVQGTATFDDFVTAAKARRQLTYLTIDTTGACDLKCAGMCYYNPNISLSRPLASEEALKDAIRQAASELSMRVLAFAGKEPFLNAGRLFSLIGAAGSIPEREFLVGIVTNGRHIAGHAEALRAASAAGSLDYIDVSIDTADAVEHDLFRGVAGTHDRAMAAVEWLNRELTGVRTTVVSVLRGNNHQGILNLIRNLSPVNAYYQVQPIQPPPYSSIEPLRPDYIVRFLHLLIDTLANATSGGAVRVSIELLGIYLLEVVNAGIFSWSDIQEDENATLYVERRIGDNTLIITCELFPLQAWRLARVTYTGAYLAHMQFLQAQDPDQHAVGFVGRETIGALFDRAMDSASPFAQVAQTRSVHECDGRPCWLNCFGGWNGAENALLENGRKLSDQPRLCTKSREDLAQLEVTSRHEDAAEHRS